MEWLVDIFSHVCGQGRCFLVGGAALPICQRCLGLYVGALLTGVWIIAGGARGRGLPSWSVFVVDTAALAAAMLGGLHVVEGGPALRMTCGQWTGHVAMLWLVGAAVQLAALRNPSKDTPPWRLRDKAGGVAMVAAMPLVAGAFGWLAALGWWFWTAAAVAGLVLLVLAVAWSLIEAARWAAAYASRGRSLAGSNSRISARASTSVESTTGRP
ncbi:MAG TPA: DUF2085 domain-containing protein [Phycisphaerae bacterium]|nr:DUF2085 domain-containing protein [Phycisphaerae bacterium]